MDNLKNMNQLLYCTNLFASQFKHTGEKICIYDTIMEMQNTHMSSDAIKEIVLNV